MNSHRTKLLAEATEYLALLQSEGALTTPAQNRLQEIRAEIAMRATYTQTFEELANGAKLAWRNSVRCVGRKYWSALRVRDCRHLSRPEEIFTAALEHLVLSTNGGKITPMITVFAAADSDRHGIRIWNDQLIRYAGYRQPDGSVVGDPRQVEFTEMLRKHGWKGGPGSNFDILPLVIQVHGEPPSLFEIPRSVILEVEISHPHLPWFAELGLRWHALPAISNMTLEVGGIKYISAPFSGWYMLTEVAVRNLADEERYNLLPVIARRLGLCTHSDRTLWRDRALLELTTAVMHSFDKAGVKMIDHHTATRHFVDFERAESRNGRPIYADWSWIVPPLASSTTPVFHRWYENQELKPNFLQQPAVWQGSNEGCPMRDVTDGSKRLAPCHRDERAPASRPGKKRQVSLPAL